MKKPGGSGILWILLVLGLAGCGGSGLGLLLSEGGISGTGATAGPITGFGSILVNGIEFNTADAEVTINGRAATEDDLRLGMIVRVEGEIDGNTGRAETIRYDSDLAGPIESINFATGELTILKQQVLVDNLTAINDPDRLTGLVAGEVVIVSGLLNADGVLYATRLVRNISPSSFRVIGTISNLNMSERLFSIGELRVDYGTAGVLDMIGSLSNNLNVVVEGQLNEGQLEASSIRSISSEITARANERLEIAGFVTRFISSQDFEVSGIQATTLTTTEFVYGSGTDLANNIRLEAEGTVNSAGVLELSRVWFRDISAARTRAGQVIVNGNVDSVDSNSNMLIALGVEFETTQTTVFEDRLTGLTRFSLDNVSVGDTATFWGFRLLGENRLIIERLERVQPLGAEPTRLQGPIDDANEDARTLNILGLTVMANDTTIYRRVNGNTLTVSEFFSMLQVGESLVEAQGQFAGGVLTAEELLLR
ncbi:MAG: DUF5666 domain-containing protein [Pseudomonadota bacterium]